MKFKVYSIEINSRPVISFHENPDRLRQRKNPNNKRKQPNFRTQARELKIQDGKYIPFQQ